MHALSYYSQVLQLGEFACILVLALLSPTPFSIILLHVALLFMHSVLYQGICSYSLLYLIDITNEVYNVCARYIK